MKLWLKANFLFALLFVSSSDPTPECEELVKPLPLDDISKIYGKRNLLLAYTEHDVYQNLMKRYESYWWSIAASPAGTGHILMTQIRVNGTCIGATMNLTIVENTANLKLPGYSADYKVLKLDGYVILSANSTTENMGKIRRNMNLEATAEDEEVTTRAIYLMAANETTVADSDLEHFKKTAQCLGFSGEPHFHYNPEKSLCQEHEGKWTQAN